MLEEREPSSDSLWAGARLQMAGPTEQVWGREARDWEPHHGETGKGVRCLIMEVWHLFL